MIEHRRGELRRLSGRRLAGRVMQYGSEAQIPGIGRERFAVFAFADYLRSGADTRLNLMHENDLVVATRRAGSLTLTDSPEALAMAAELPAGDAYDQVLDLVGDGLTNGLSVEFHALRERRHGGLRTIHAATLPALGIVDDPAYQTSGVELRRRGRGLSGEFRYGRDRVRRDRGRRRKTRVRAGAFSWQLEEFQRVQDELSGTIAEAVEAGARDALTEAGLREVQLLAGRSYDAPLGSLTTGTLRLEDTDEALRFEVDRLPDTSYAADLRAAMDARSADYGVDVLYSIPPADVVPDAVSIEIEPETGVEVEAVNRGILQALAVVSRPPRGNSGTVEKRSITTRRRLVWL